LQLKASTVVAALAAVQVQEAVRADAALEES